MLINPFQVIVNRCFVKEIATFFKWFKRLFNLMCKKIRNTKLVNKN